MQARGREETANEAAPLRRRCLRRSWLLTQDEETSDARAFPALAWDRGQRDVINARAASTNALRALSRSRHVTRREVVRANEVRGRVYGRDMPIERVLSVKRLSDTSLADGARHLTAFCPSTFSLQHRARQEVASSDRRALLRPHIAKVRSVTDPARASDRVPPRPGALRVSRDAPGAGSGAPRWLLPSRFSARPERRLTRLSRSASTGSIHTL